MFMKTQRIALVDQLRKSALETERSGSCARIGTELELARNFSLSRVTVRRAVDTLVNEGLLERKPGKGLFVRAPGNTTCVVQVMAGNLRWDPAIHMERAARKFAKGRHVQIQLSDAHGHVDDDLAAIRKLPASGAKGAIIMSLHCAAFHQVLCELVAVKFPFVVVDQQLNEIQATSVCSDNVSGGRRIAAALLEAGHRRIAFIGDLTTSTTHDRLIGLREELLNAGVRLACAEDVQGEDRLGEWAPHITPVVNKLMKSSSPPTALVCSCDAIARTAYRALEKLRLRIPGDVSVTGYDDDPLAEWLTPPLSTVRQPFAEIGRAAMELLLKRIANPMHPPEHVVLPVSFIARSSIAPPKR
jgi:LacI family transcriptional regulator